MSTCPYTGDLDKFHAQPVSERRALASHCLAGYQELSKGLIEVRRDVTDLHGLVAYVAVKQQIEAAIVFWRREMYRAAWESQNKKGSSKAGRRPAAMAHGCAAFASLAGSFSGALNRSGNAGRVAT